MIVTAEITSATHRVINYHADSVTVPPTRVFLWPSIDMMIGCNYCRDSEGYSNGKAPIPDFRVKHSHIKHLKIFYALFTTLPVPQVHVQ